MIFTSFKLVILSVLTLLKNILHELHDSRHGNEKHTLLIKLNNINL